MDKNAILLIRNSKEFEDDIWQYGVSCAPNFNNNQWKSVIESFAESLQNIYHCIDNGEEVDDSNLYVLGDVINLFQSIDVIRESNI